MCFVCTNFFDFVIEPRNRHHSACIVRKLAGVMRLRQQYQYSSSDHWDPIIAFSEETFVYENYTSLIKLIKIHRNHSSYHISIIGIFSTIKTGGCLNKN